MAKKKKAKRISRGQWSKRDLNMLKKLFPDDNVKNASRRHKNQPLISEGEQLFIR
jgi:hypothetical protein